MTNEVFGFLSDFMSGQGRFVTASGELIAKDDVEPKHSITLFVPGIDVGIFSAVIPARIDAEAQQAAPFAIEDELAGQIEDTHFVLGPVEPETGGRRKVYTVTKSRLAEWADWLAGQKGMSEAMLVAEQSVLPARIAYQTPDYCLVNNGDKAFAVDGTLDRELLDGLLEGGEVVALSRESLLERLADHAAKADALIDLHTGARPFWGFVDLSRLRDWTLSAVLAATILVLWCIGTIIETASLRSDTKALEASIEDAYARSFPDAPKPTNYLRAVTRATDETGAANIEFLEASAALYKALEEIPSARLVSLKYDRYKADFTGLISYQNFGDDAILKAGLEAEGVSVRLGDTRQQSEGVVGTVTIIERAS